MELIRGIAGSLNDQAVMVRRLHGPRLTRKNRTVRVSGPMELIIAYERPYTTIRSADDAAIVWTSRSGGLLIADASLEEATLVCSLVVNAVDQSSSLWRYAAFI
jgi:hypothetical protein